MEFSWNATKVALAIPAAAEVLQVTEKTVRNYIDRGILRAEKWNGAWRIPADSLDEVYAMKHGRPWKAVPEPADKDLASSRGGPARLVASKSGQEEMIRFETRCQIAEAEAERLRSQVTDLHARIARLEASASSAWTESRNHKDQATALRSELESERDVSVRLRIENEGLRKDLDRSNADLGLQGQRLADTQAELDAASRSSEQHRTGALKLRGEVAALRARWLEG